MRYAKKIIFILSRCSVRMNTIRKSFIRQHQRYRRKVRSLTKAALTLRLSTLSTLYWNLIARALILRDLSISRAAAIQEAAVVWCPQIRHLKNVVYSQTRQITLQFLHSMLQQSHSSRPLAWTIINLRVFRHRHREFEGSQIFCKVQVPLK